jgi:hypothetical protein
VQCALYVGVGQVTPIKGETCSCNMVKLNEEDTKPCPDVPKQVKVQSQSHTSEEKQLTPGGELYERHHEISTVVIAGGGRARSEAKSISAVGFGRSRKCSEKRKIGRFRRLHNFSANMASFASQALRAASRRVPRTASKVAPKPANAASYSLLAATRSSALPRRATTFQVFCQKKSRI